MESITFSFEEIFLFEDYRIKNPENILWVAFISAVVWQARESKASFEEYNNDYLDLNPEVKDKTNKEKTLSAMCPSLLNYCVLEVSFH